MTAGLKFTGVRHAFGGVEVLNGVDITAERARVTCLLGPSGCGKTTLLRVAAGLERLQQGRVEIAGEVMADAGADAGAHTDTPPERRGVGLMFQDFALFPHLTILENVTFGTGAGTPERRAWALKHLEIFGLSDLAGRYPAQLSGGQQQRAALLRALAPEPRALLLDEPFSGLDAALRAHVREDAFHLLRETGVTALMVTHDPEEAMGMADSILVMREGRIVQSGAPMDVYFHPRDRFVTQLFGPANILPARVKNGLAQTPLGAFAAGPDTPEGAAVDVLIRPEGLRPADALPARAPPPVQDGAGGPNGANSASGADVSAPDMRHPPSPPASARVHFAQLLGRASHLHIRLDAAPDLELHARVPGVYLPEPGAHIDFVVDPGQAFVFPAAPESKN
ncbi:MAG: ABC transporter ATP-binding protein [Rhodospirillales bacterium]